MKTCVRARYRLRNMFCTGDCDFATGIEIAHSLRMLSLARRALVCLQTVVASYCRLCSSPRLVLTAITAAPQNLVKIAVIRLKS